MKKNGFTLVEIMAVIIILTVIMLIAVPSYRLVMVSINQKTLENKVQVAVSAAESYAEETGSVVVTPKLLIEAGKLEADNEAGEYLNPVTKEDMACNIIEIKTNDIGNKYGMFTSEKNCTDNLDELNEKYGDITIIKKDISGNVLTNEWVNVSPVILSYEFKPVASGLKSFVVGQKWLGEEESEEETKTVTATSVKTGIYGVNVTTRQNGVTTYHTASTELKIDLQAPIIEKLEIENENEYTKDVKVVNIEANDKNGSGIYGYKVIGESEECSKEREEYTVSDKIIKATVEEGKHKICVMDKAGNTSNTEVFEINKIDKSGPEITSFVIQSKDSRYNTLDVIAKITVNEINGPVNVYLSNTGYEKDGSWRRHSNSLDFRISGGYDGIERTVYLVLEDKFGNKTETTAKYTPYKDCTNTTTDYEVTGGSGEYFTGNLVTKDNYTGTRCVVKPAEKGRFSTCPMESYTTTCTKRESYQCGYEECNCRYSYDWSYSYSNTYTQTWVYGRNSAPTCSSSSYSSCTASRVGSTRTECYQSDESCHGGSGQKNCRNSSYNIDNKLKCQRSNLGRIHVMCIANSQGGYFCCDWLCDTCETEFKKTTYTCERDKSCSSCPKTCSRDVNYSCTKQRNSICWRLK